jgi:hypothetical protein
MLNSKRLKKGQCQWEWFYSYIKKCDMVQYDYRAPDGVLFSTIAKTYEDAVERKNEWMKNRV